MEDKRGSEREGSVLAAIVTYGDRADRLLETAAAALTAGADRVLVVDNGSSSTAAARIDQLAQQDARVLVHRLGANGGSALGFSEAIRVGTQLGTQYVLLLDDDNVLVAGSLGCAVTILQGARVDAPMAVAIPRVADETHAAMLAGAPAAWAYAGGGEFFEFDVRKRLRRRAAGTLASPMRVASPVPRTPYGGLLLRSVDVPVLGIPRAEFVLYCDDYEYTERYARHGGAILLSPHGGIEDRGLRWGDADSSNISKMIESRDQFRTYYLYRNCAVVELERARRTGHLAWFVVNGIVYSAYALVQAVRHRSWRFLATYARAELDAVRGRMGKRCPLPGDEVAPR